MFTKPYTKGSFFIILGFMILLAAATDFLIYKGLEYAGPVLAQLVESGDVTGEILYLNRVSGFLSERFFSLVVPVTGGVFVIFSILLWGGLRLYGKSAVEKAPAEEEKETGRSGKGKDAADQRIEQERRQRIFLHMLSVLQREGRLLDFFDEDLSNYEDEQIGAAVRSIHEDCKKAVQRYISPRPFFTEEEGENVEIKEGFDPDSVKLTGNVTGSPPFKGVLKHRGWKAGKKEVPRLSDRYDPAIITPAEVEIG
ncbi:MAG: DUF2760 domain-containing protein [Desulfobacteraceae bacterium]